MNGVANSRGSSQARTSRTCRTCGCYGEWPLSPWMGDCDSRSLRNTVTRSHCTRSRNYSLTRTVTPGRSLAWAIHFPLALFAVVYSLIRHCGLPPTEPSSQPRSTHVVLTREVVSLASHGPQSPGETNQARVFTPRCGRYCSYCGRRAG